LKERTDRKLKFNISEIFHSIQGEGSRAGRPCVFIRMQGCELRCSWCDTPYALDIKETANLMSSDEILDAIANYNCKLINLTGGEPLIHKNISILIDRLMQEGYEVTIETNGHADISIAESAVRIMDLKCPDSGMSKFNNYKNIDYISKKDEIKFVVASKSDFDWAVKKIDEYKLEDKAGYIFISPVFGKIELEELANLVTNSGKNIRMQLQMHKFIWDPNKRGV
jgi:7-carboxy-7-deazaguanine synthase